MTNAGVATSQKDANAFARWEPHIRSFVCLSEPMPAPTAGPLSGLTVGVKDIIDVSGLPTHNGSATCADASPAQSDASVVARLRAAGAQIVGKTVTTEFAFTDPTDCRNPYDIARSPGGSSSGSGAAVAAGLVDLALGTQTAGSLCRPAAYCGAVGLKPSFRSLPTAGVTPLARSFDSVGVIARSVDVARAAFLAMCEPEAGVAGHVSIATRWLLPGDIRPAPDIFLALEAATEALSRYCQVRQAPSVPCDTDAIVNAHRTVMQAEAAEVHNHLLHGTKADLLRPKFRAGLEAGVRFNAADIAAARHVLKRATEEFWRAMQGVDAILTLPVPEGAPRLDGSTGFQDWLTPWTVFGGPLITLPWGLDRSGRPCAVMLAGKPTADLSLLDLAEQLERHAPPIVPPEPPSV